MEEIKKWTSNSLSSVNPTNNDLPKNKVTVGFTCTPEFKLQLSNQATKRNMTLSAWIELSLLNFREVKASTNFGNVADDKEKGLVAKVTELEKRLSLYENNPQLLKIYTDIKNETHVLTNAEGQELTINVRNPIDAYNVLLNSFQITKPQL